MCQQVKICHYEEIDSKYPAIGRLHMIQIEGVRDLTSSFNFIKWSNIDVVNKQITPIDNVANV